jgi:EAL domain-containing protein (putative c-di-GMP-specific phosphodiesterase class I)
MKNMTITLLSHQSLYHLFQPVCTLTDKKPLGYEALIRSKWIERPDQLFNRVIQQHQLFKLDILSIYNGILVFFSTPERRDSDELLFLNIFPSSLAEDAFSGFCKKIVREFPAYVHRIVFEINESMSETGEWNREMFLKNVNLLREFGFRIAFDDVGEGATTLKRIVELSPDFIKIDRFFGMQLKGNKKKQHIIKFFVDYCADDTMLILEGLEQSEDMELAIDLGVRLGQGYGLDKPGPLPGSPLNFFQPMSMD